MRTVAAQRLPAGDEEYWDWLAVALFLLVTVDLLTTLGAAARFGVGAEANPFVADLLRGPLWLLIGVHLGVVLVVAGGFSLLVRQLERTPARLRPGLAFVVETWLGLLVAAGLVVFANNLVVVVHGVSLF